MRLIYIDRYIAVSFLTLLFGGFVQANAQSKGQVIVTAGRKEGDMIVRKGRRLGHVDVSGLSGAVSTITWERPLLSLTAHSIQGDETYLLLDIHDTGGVHNCPGRTEEFLAWVHLDRELKVVDSASVNLASCPRPMWVLSRRTVKGRVEIHRTNPFDEPKGTSLISYDPLHIEKGVTVTQIPEGAKRP
jgi:hypothetical protein